MAFKHGSTTNLKIDDAAGTLRDLSAYVTASDNPFERDMHDVTTYGNTGHRQFPGLVGGSFKVTGVWDPTTTTGPDVVMSGLLLAGVGAASSTIEFSPFGTATGGVKYSGEYFLKSYSGPKSTATGMVEFDAEFILDGVPTRTVL